MPANESQQCEVTRLAPSPTGALHLGNARSFLINWALARQRGWAVKMRIEDLDGPRIKQDAADQALDTLAWLGLDWDGEPMYQSHDLAPYHAALEKLAAKGLTYACTCTRREIELAQSAPHESDGEMRYPGTCRVSGTYEATPLAALPQSSATRARIPDEPLMFVDGFVGPYADNVQRRVGDFVVATKNGLPAYQLAVVVDDARQGVTQVVRGDDLLSSAARQLWLYRMLDLSPLPSYTHLPLVLGADGKRLAKRHGDTRLRTYRTNGVSAERIVGLLAYWAGIIETRKELSATQFAERFCLENLSPRPVTFSKDDDQWLGR